MLTIPHRIAGIPCLIGIENYFEQKPDRHAESRDDCYGYAEFEIQILDRKGYKADWLARKMTSADQAAVEDAIETARRKK